MRAGVTLAGPLVVGVAVDELVIGLWISLGALMLAAGEKPATYRTRFMQCAVITPLGSSAVLLGALSEVPSLVAVAVMTAVAFVAGILSGYSAALSMGSMQAMILSAVSIGVPAADPYWRSALLVAAGGVLYTAVLGIEALTDRRRPVRAALADIMSALTALAEARAAGSDDLSELRAAAMESIDELTSMAVTHRATASGPSADSYRAGAVIRTADALMARLMSTATTPQQARHAAARLAEFGQAVAADRRPGPRTVGPDTDETLHRVDALEAAIWGGTVAGTGMPDPGRRRLTWPGNELLGSAGRFALCICVAYVVCFSTPVGHPYWVPLTVAMVMKPDLGSIFSRAVNRCIGTILAALGVTVLGVVIDRPIEIACAVGVFAACMPWAMGRSYLYQTLFLTPVILFTLDLVRSHDTTVLDLAAERMINTSAGALIVVVLGYLPWPSTRHARIGPTFVSVLGSLAEYAREVGAQAPEETISAHRLQTYHQLSDARVTLQRTLSEPPPAGVESWAWIPVVATAESIADAITAASATSLDSAAAERFSELAGELEELSRGESTRAGVGERHLHAPADPSSLSDDPAVNRLDDAIRHLRSMLRPTETEQSSTAG
ncbi:FUSC family protein [Gordonia aurantiaca]|uniref:FUSC family protein n=1 Tax=Gordonia sp. B21 TaxID=3151852 RepID=UPI003264556C